MQRRSLGSMLAVCLCSGLAACGSIGDLGAYKSGTQVSDAQMAQIVDHRTTSVDVAKLIGQPEEKSTGRRPGNLAVQVHADRAGPR